MGFFNRTPKRVVVAKHYSKEVRDQQIWTLAALRLNGGSAQSINKVAREMDIFSGIEKQTLSNRNGRAKKLLQWLDSHNLQITQKL